MIHMILCVHDYHPYRFIFSKCFEKMLWPFPAASQRVPSLPGPSHLRRLDNDWVEPPLVWKRSSMNLPNREELLFRTVHASADMAVSGGELVGKITIGPGGHFVAEQFKEYTPKN